jgi:hypothetical protein
VELIAAAQIKNDERMGQVMDAMNRLANIKRIDRLEDRPQ